MFGNAPKAVWLQWAPPDDRNRIALACRCLLVRDDRGRTILLETGIGNFFDPALRERYGVEEERHVLLDSLRTIGVAPTDIDVVVLSHLHFDHAGGLLTEWNPHHPPALVFPSARFLVSRAAWARARNPHPRDRASFIPALTDLLEGSGRLDIVDGRDHPTLGDGFTFTFSDGHTPGLMLTTVATRQGPITFMGDLVPGRAWVHLPITMGYDRFPELLIEEKKAVLETIQAHDGWMFFTHDPTTSAARVTKDERGRFSGTDAIDHLRWTDTPRS